MKCGGNFCTKKPPIRQRKPKKTVGNKNHRATMPAHKPCCWGLVASNGLAPCDRGFEPRSGHVQFHFCDVCRKDGLALPVDRVRALTDDQMNIVSKPLGRGFFKSAESVGIGGDGFVRVVNHTITCQGPWLIIFRRPPSESFAFLPVPAHWVHNNHVVFVVSKNTLVPMVAMGGPAATASITTSIPMRKRRLGERVGGRRQVVSCDERANAWLYQMVSHDA